MAPRWDGKAWVDEVRLDAWSAFLRGHSWIARVVFLPDDLQPKETPPSAIQLATLRRLEAAQATLHDRVAAALRSYYDSVRPRCLAFAQKFPRSMGDPAVTMPAEPDLETLGRLHELTEVFVHPTASNGIAYVGLFFSATWEPEHGLGVLTHDCRVVDVGGFDTAFLSGSAEKDAESR